MNQYYAHPSPDSPVFVRVLMQDAMTYELYHEGNLVASDLQEASMSGEAEVSYEGYRLHSEWKGFKSTINWYGPDPSSSTAVKAQKVKKSSFRSYLERYGKADEILGPPTSSADVIKLMGTAIGLFIIGCIGVAAIERYTSNSTVSTILSILVVVPVAYFVGQRVVSAVEGFMGKMSGRQASRLRIAAYGGIGVATAVIGSKYFSFLFG